MAPNASAVGVVGDRRRRALGKARTAFALRGDDKPAGAGGERPLRRLIDGERGSGFQLYLDLPDRRLAVARANFPLVERELHFGARDRRKGARAPDHGDIDGPDAGGRDCGCDVWRQNLFQRRQVRRGAVGGLLELLAPEQPRPRCGLDRLDITAVGHAADAQDGSGRLERAVGRVEIGGFEAARLGVGVAEQRLPDGRQTLRGNRERDFDFLAHRPLIITPTGPRFERIPMGQTNSAPLPPPNTQFV